MKSRRREVEIVDVSKDAYNSYRAAIRIATDWETLAEIAEGFTSNPKLTKTERDELVELSNAKERDLRSDGFLVRFTRKDS